MDKQANLQIQELFLMKVLAGPVEFLEQQYVHGIPVYSVIKFHSHEDIWIHSNL